MKTEDYLSHMYDITEENRPYLSTSAARQQLHYDPQVTVDKQAQIVVFLLSVHQLDMFL